MLIEGFSNFSNAYTRTDNTNLSRLLNDDGDFVFGLEIVFNNNNSIKQIISPSYMRINRHSKSIRDYTLENMKFYDVSFAQPSFLPLYCGLNGNFINGLNEIELAIDEKLFIQFLFRPARSWGKNALEMYSSYLGGNTSPFTNKILRAIQDKIIHYKNKLTNNEVYFDYAEEIESKILDKGFQFQIRIGIKSENEKEIVKIIKSLISEYDYYNSLQLVELKNCENYVKNCVLGRDKKNHIVSSSEVSSLLGGEKVVVTSVVDINRYNNVLDVLPYSPNIEVTPPKDIISRVASALKQVGLINTSRIYNELVTTGVRLTTVQFDIPKEKVLTQLQSKQKDIQAVLGVTSLSVEQGNLPNTVKITLPNEQHGTISLRELVEQDIYSEFRRKNELSFVVGVDEVNNPVYLSLSKLVHLLVAGTTGSGKSVFVNSVVVSLLLHHSPKQLQLYMIDPKEVEMQHYTDFPHVREVVTDMDKATKTLLQLVNEMEKRYALFKKNRVKSIKAYNTKMNNILPYLVCVIDEYADLKDVNPNIETYIGRLGQKARAAGIHLIIATQRPSTDIISGRIKAVIPNAISFNLSSNTNYKTVFGKGIGNISLLGRGDGIMKIEGYPKEFQRFQSPIISPNENKEEKVFSNLSRILNDKYSDFDTQYLEVVNKEEGEDKIDNELSRLKEIIANTNETRVTQLRKEMRIKTSTLSNLMDRLVKDGWLERGKSKSEGYNLVAPKSELDKWKSK